MQAVTNLREMLPNGKPQQSITSSPWLVNQGLFLAWVIPETLKEIVVASGLAFNINGKYMERSV